MSETSDTDPPNMEIMYVHGYTNRRSAMHSASGDEIWRFNLLWYLETQKHETN